uniref:Uncharacterized protein n=1 Tax=Oryza brachyantha TaxID=4533 RepID=J3LQY3_ORYBR
MAIYNADGSVDRLILHRRPFPPLTMLTVAIAPALELSCLVITTAMTRAPLLPCHNCCCFSSN